MKAVVNEIEKKETSEFPVLMELNGDVVMFIDCDRGTLVASKGRPEDVGEQSRGWLMSQFQDFKGTVTLSND